MSNPTRRSSDQENLINASVISDEAHEIDKKQQIGSDGQTPQEAARSRKVKIALLVILAIVMTVGLILVIVSLVKKSEEKIENTQEYNMFSGKLQPFALQFYSIISYELDRYLRK